MLKFRSRPVSWQDDPCCYSLRFQFPSEGAAVAEVSPVSSFNGREVGEDMWCWEAYDNSRFECCDPVASGTCVSFDVAVAEAEAALITRGLLFREDA